MKTAAIVLVAAATGGDVPPPESTYSHAEMQHTVAQAVQFGRQLGIAEASAALEEARKTLERCAISRGI